MAGHRVAFEAIQINPRPTVRIDGALKPVFTGKNARSVPSAVCEMLRIDLANAHYLEGERIDGGGRPGVGCVGSAYIERSRARTLYKYQPYTPYTRSFRPQKYWPVFSRIFL